MPTRVASFAILVPDYDAGLAFYRDKLGFDLREDSDLGNGKRWIRLGLPDAKTEVLLARAVGAEQSAAIGKQGGGRVWLFLETDTFDQDFKAFCDAGVLLEAPARDEPYGRVAVFQDPWGNRFDLIQYADPDTRGGTAATKSETPKPPTR